MANDDPAGVGGLLRGFLLHSRLAQPGEAVRVSALSGGVSSDIWRVEIGEGGGARTVCVKRALAQLKVAAEWKVSPERNAFEWAWLKFAARTLPGAAPTPLAHDPELGMLAMAYLPPEQYPVWKQQLLEGHVDARTAAQVGERLCRLHAASAGRADLQAEFSSDDLFFALRLEPYLLATAQAHPDLGPELRALVSGTAGRRVALVHGDVSPKNILVGADGPLFVDAECAWYGDPAFDLAFCLNHLLLKALPCQGRLDELLHSFESLRHSYLEQVTWEAPAEVEARSAALLPALMLARIDGKSPLEYVTDPAQKDRVRTVARPLIAAPVRMLGQVAQVWRAANE
ncbi:phosphotransferase [Deinococcus sp.]|uniref:phosphotransferase n=1 Tax=Deinococcus sp. TaxID=47478 RepID=UPI003C799758